MVTIHGLWALIPNQNVTGVNAYAVSSSPRASSNEAIVISASWIRRHEGGPTELNLRGVSAILALAKYLKGVSVPASRNPCNAHSNQGHSMWAKDIVFVVSDGYLDGMQAWLGSYHGSKQTSRSRLPFTPADQ